MKIKVAFIVFFIAIFMICFSAGAFADGCLRFQTEQLEVDAGDTVNIDYEVLAENITITNVIWREKYSHDYGGSYGSGSGCIYSGPKGTLSYRPQHDGECWLEFSYVDEQGKIHTEKSDIIKVNGIIIEFSAPSSDSIEAGTEFSISYKIVNGKENCTVTSYWEVHTETSTATVNRKVTHESEGTFSYIPKGSVKYFRYNISFENPHGAHEFISGPYGGTWIEVVNSEEDPQNPENIIFKTTQNNVYAGDTISVEYEIINDGITVTDAWWREKYSNGSGQGTGCQIIKYKDTVTYTPRNDGTCWFEITYVDEAGGIYTERSPVINVNGIIIDVSVPSTKTAEVGFIYPISYRITGGRGNYTVTTYLEVSTGDTYATINRKDTHEAEGVINYTPNSSIQRFRYAISVVDDYGGYAFYIGPYGGTWVNVIPSHDWNSPKYIWAFDYSTLTARTQCKNHPDQIMEETVETNIDIVSPSEANKGHAFIRSQGFTNTSFKPQTKYIVIPALREMSVLYLPNCVESIESESFANTSCQAIIIPQGCKTIKNKAFANCHFLIYVSVPESLQSIATDAFEGCESIIVDK